MEISERKKRDGGEEQDAEADTLWRTPIKLDLFEPEDDLESLYRGREVVADHAQEVPKKRSGSKSGRVTSKSPGTGSKTKTNTPKQSYEQEKQEGGDTYSTKITKAELKNILKIKSDTYQFTDIREILRGKSFDMYAYLRFLSGESGVCKIKHLDLMKNLNVSRPTLFKQGDWLVRLGLIEKRSVPGDHLGTSYTVYRLEDVLPVPESLVSQVQSAIVDLETATISH